MDKISIRNLEVFARHGVMPEENVLGQKFVVSAALFLDLREAGRTGDLSKTVDYGEICQCIKAFVEGDVFSVIETVAERLAEKLLLDNPMLQRVWLEIKKPWAPVAVHLETVSVEIERSRHTAFISLGSNIGDREGHLRFGISELEKAFGCRVVRTSSFIVTAPYGDPDLDDFLNGCLELETLLTPQELLGVLKGAEKSAGREADGHFLPRTLDLDLILYDDAVISENALRVPHADMHNREFVLAPLCEIAPFKLHPVLKKTVAEMLAELRE